MASQTVPSICRNCLAYCPILVTVEDGRAVKVAGDPEAPAFDGYTCPKGRALPAQHNGPARILRCLARDADGRFTEVAADTMLDDVAKRVRALIDEHGPRSVAMYRGTGPVSHPVGAPLVRKFFRAIGSGMVFSAATIDKPAEHTSVALHGNWRAGLQSFESTDTWMVVGANPIIAKSNGGPLNNPGMRLKEAVERGLKLIVIDPRRSETARHAHVHLQARPGEDPALLAGILHVLLAEDLVDHDFVRANAQGLEALREAVRDYTPEWVAARADVPVDAGISQKVESLKYSGVSRGYPIPWGQYTPAVAQPPAGAELVDDATFFFRLAQRMGLQLEWINPRGQGPNAEGPSPAIPLDMARVPTADEMVELSCRNSRIPLEEVKRHPHGHVWDLDVRVAPREPDCTARLELGAARMMDELRQLRAEVSPAVTDAEYPLQLLCRRANNFMNSVGQEMPQLARGARLAPAAMHGTQLAALGLREGDTVRIRSRHGTMRARVEADDALRPGTVSVVHGFGAAATLADADPELAEASVNRLVGLDERDPISGIPRMTGVAVVVEALPQP